MVAGGQQTNMEQKQESRMKYNERLLHEALEGNKDSFKELKFNAGAGDAEAQYYYAQYYAKVSDEDFRYWIRKAIVENKYFQKQEDMLYEKAPQDKGDSAGMSFTESVKTCLPNTRRSQAGHPDQSIGGLDASISSSCCFG